MLRWLHQVIQVLCQHKYKRSNSDHLTNKYDWLTYLHCVPHSCSQSLSAILSYIRTEQSHLHSLHYLIQQDNQVVSETVSIHETDNAVAVHKSMNKTHSLSNLSWFTHQELETCSLSLLKQCSCENSEHLDCN